MSKLADKKYTPIYKTPNKFGQIATECCSFDWTCEPDHKGTCKGENVCKVLLGLKCDETRNFTNRRK